MLHRLSLLWLFVRPFLNKDCIIRDFHYKVSIEILDEIIYTNERLAKIGYFPKDTCAFW